MKYQLTIREKAILIVLLFLNLVINAQDIPIIKTDDSTLGLQKLDIKVDIVGNIATTTYDMVFYNPKNRVLEGELSFPLGENQKVNRFALELNGNLREAVVVEKELGRVAFETTIRQKIDPALLEQTKGNNYKARIYPIPAKGTKRVVLSFQQELYQSNNSHNYDLPLNFKKELKIFHFEMTVFGQDVIPVETNQQLIFDKWQKKYRLKIDKTNYKANKSLKISIPISLEKEKLITGKNYFYWYKSIHENSKLKTKPSSIVLLWDVSLSMKKRNLENELALLKNYFKYLDNVSVKVKKFSNTIISEQDFVIANGESNSLLEYLKYSNYDGATSYTNLFDFKQNYSECLLFTDGMDNFGGFPTTKATPIYGVNSLSVSNHVSLKTLSENSGGRYINLNYTSIDNAHKSLINQMYRFLGVEKQNDNLAIFPNRPTVVSGGFSISGKKYKEGDELTLLFGYGNVISERIKIRLINDYNEVEQLENIWAQKKLASLLIDKGRNKEEIIHFSKKYQLISPFTSLIVLDRIEDYERYEIDPPKELKAEYKRRMARKHKDEDNSYLKNSLFRKYNQLSEWLGTRFGIVEKQDNEQTEVSNAVVQRQEDNGSEDDDPDLRSIHGVVSDGLGPVADISVKVKGTSRGTITDFDGRYSVKAKVGDVIQFQHVSYSSQEKVVGNNSKIDLSVIEQGKTLQEIVVTAYAIQRKRRSLSSVVTVRSEEISERPKANLIQTLQGQVSGLDIKINKAAPGTSSKINLRGVGSITSTNEPLFVVDGMIVDENNFKSIGSEDIDSVSILKNSNATTLYGSRGTNGVIIVTTKKGLINKSSQIAKFNSEMNDKIELKPWNSNTPYLKQIHQGKNLEEKYYIYLDLRNNYANQPTFYLDVADYFIEKNHQEIAIRILSNIAEIDIENYELLRALAYKLEALNQYQQAVLIYKEILSIRPEDIQSYRDLALAYQTIGEYQKGLDLFYKIVKGELLIKDKERRFEGIEEIAFIEMNNLISKHKNQLNLVNIDKKFIKKTTMDFRVVIDWNHNDTDIDLWVIDPNNEKCYYSHKQTKIGGKISNDMTNGFGPEEFILKKVIKGDYDLIANYYANSQQKISGPAILKVTVYKNYGLKTETKTVKVIRLDKDEDKIDLGKVKF